MIMISEVAALQPPAPVPPLAPEAPLDPEAPEAPDAPAGAAPADATIIMICPSPETPAAACTILRGNVPKATGRHGPPAPGFTGIGCVVPLAGSTRRSCVVVIARAGPVAPNAIART